MTDLQAVLPDFHVQAYSHLVPSLDKALISTADLLTLDVAQLAKRAQLPAAELRKLIDAVVLALHRDVGVGEVTQEGDAATDTDTAIAADTGTAPWRCISTLDATLDAALGGGLPTRYLTEITGESGAGKTQFLLTLLLAAQLPPPLGLARPAIYISTEAVLSTKRLAQLLSTHPVLSALPAAQRPSLSRILSIQTPDLETQDHILRYQLPVAVKKHNVGLIILDSVAANYRAEFDAPGGNGAEAMAQRSAQLIQLGALLRQLARTEELAVVVANQVADRFTREAPVSRMSSANSQTSTQNRTPQPDDAHTPTTATTNATTPAAGMATDMESPIPLSADPLALDHQQRWFTGWGDDPSSAHPKTPSLGLVWTNQLACRIALVKEAVLGVRGVDTDGSTEKDGADEGRGEGYIVRWRRWARVVFAPWTVPTEGRGVEFEIVGGGIRAVGADGAGEGAGENKDDKHAP